MLIRQKFPGLNILRKKLKIKLPMKKRKNIVWFNQVDKQDIELVGGKGANLGEMVSFGIPIPPGFIVTSKAYFDFLKENKLRERIKKVLKSINVDEPTQLEECARRIQSYILGSDVPVNIAKEVMSYYLALSKINEKTYTFASLTDRIIASFSDTYVAVRSSATAEDLPDASFAGQQETYLNVIGESNVVNAVKKCWASLFTPRAIFYREQNKFSHFKVGIAVPVQKMIQSESSGVLFTINPTTNEKSEIIIEAVYGLGELIVQGAVIPDHYVVRKSDLRLLKKEVACQEKMLVMKKRKNVLLDLGKRRGSEQKVTDKNIKKLAFWGKKIEKHYYFPQDIEWGIEKGKIYILQSRPVTTLGKAKKITEKEISALTGAKKEILSGIGASTGIVSGRVKIVKNMKELSKIETGDILVAKMTNPDYVTAMKKVNGIITDEGGRTCHAAIVSRELGIACVVGAKKATKILKKNMLVTIDGEKGIVYEGGIEVKPAAVARKEAFVPLQKLTTATKIYVNMSTPELASEIGKKHVDGVGLLRAEFMIAQIGVHPRKLIAEKKQKMFIDKLAEGIKTICEAFNPRPVIYRATDFKTNEYRNLIGGAQFEQEEPNPMLGFRGAYRYIKNDDVFELELAAIKKVRNKYGLKNLWLMIPFVRTVKELSDIKKIVSSCGIFRSATFKLWMMAEIPSNVFLLDEFIKVGIDGISIGSNDLTMLILGVDRDNSEVASIYDERNEAVYRALEKIIKGCLAKKVTCSICGQAPSDFPDFTEKLINWGITSISVNPDAIERTREIVYEAEKGKVLSK